MLKSNMLKPAVLGATLAMALFAGGVAAQNSDTATSSSAASKTGGDAMFVKKASAAGAAEVALGKLGQSQGQSDQVKQFGAQMVKDHTAANDELSSIASEKGLTVATDPSPKDAAAAKMIGAKQGAAFDTAFSKKMLMDHKQAVALFTQEANSGKDSDLKAFAAKTLPTLKHHLEMAQSLPMGSSGKSD
jgi:putative membrane protein